MLTSHVIDSFTIIEPEIMDKQYQIVVVVVAVVVAFSV